MQATSAHRLLTTDAVFLVCEHAGKLQKQIYMSMAQQAVYYHF